MAPEISPEFIRKQLAANQQTFAALFNHCGEEWVHWKPHPDKWNLLEIACHLYDEEREDFRARVKHILFTPDAPMPPIHPQEWVADRRYAEQNFSETCARFLEERSQSVEWLENLREPAWGNEYMHPKVGPISARMILANWLAHDYLHIRQITRLKYDYLLQNSGEDMNYAGNW